MIFGAAFHVPRSVSGGLFVDHLNGLQHHIHHIAAHIVMLQSRQAGDCIGEGDGVLGVGRRPPTVDTVVASQLKLWVDADLRLCLRAKFGHALGKQFVFFTLGGGLHRMHDVLNLK